MQNRMKKKADAPRKQVAENSTNNSNSPSISKAISKTSSGIQEEYEY